MRGVGRGATCLVGRVPQLPGVVPGTPSFAIALMIQPGTAMLTPRLLVFRSAHSLKTKQSVVSRMSNFFARKSQADVLGLESKKPKTRRASITDLLHIGQDAMNPDLLRSQAHDPLFWEMAKPYYSLAGRHYPGLEEVRDVSPRQRDVDCIGTHGLSGRHAGTVAQPEQASSCLGMQEPELHVAMFRTWVKMVSPWPGFDVYWAINMCRHEMVIIKVYNLRMMSANAASRVAREIVIRYTLFHDHSPIDLGIILRRA